MFRKYSSLSRIVLSNHNKLAQSLVRKNSTSDLEETLVPSDLILNPFAKVDPASGKYLEELTPPLKKSFNLAAYVNQSHTLQELLKIGVSLFDVENTNYKAAQSLMYLDFEKDCVEHIKFLVDHGLKEKNLGRFISEFPTVFNQPIDDLQTRLNYYESKRFSKYQIAKGLNSSSHFISNKVKTVDFKLGLLQVEFGLPASSVREIVSKYPIIIPIDGAQYKIVNITLSSEFGFNVPEIRQILKLEPCLMELDRGNLIERIDLVHNQIGLSHNAIASYPKLITGPRLEISHRAKYLKKLKRDQYNPRKPLYVPPSALYKEDDESFCRKYAKTSLSDYKLFLKSQ